MTNNLTRAYKRQVIKSALRDGLNTDQLRRRYQISGGGEVLRWILEFRKTNRF